MEHNSTILLLYPGSTCQVNLGGRGRGAVAGREPTAAIAISAMCTCARGAVVHVVGRTAVRTSWEESVGRVPVVQHQHNAL